MRDKLNREGKYRANNAGNKLEWTKVRSKKKKKIVIRRWGGWEQGIVRNDQCKDKVECSCCNKQDK